MRNNGIENNRNMRNSRNMKNYRRRALARRRRRRAVVIALLTVICLVSVAFAAQIPQKLFTVYSGSTGADLQDGNGSDSVGKNSGSNGLRIGDGLHNDDIDLSGLYSPNAILMDLDSGEVLTGVNEDKRVYPASLTKMMTAIVVLENISDWEESITVPAEIYSSLYAQNASLAGFEAGETTSIRALLYGVLLPSGAECCETLALHVAGSESAFVDMMNAKASALGMENTHFCNTTGLHDDNHYSSVKDMAILLRYALENENFREVFTTRRYSTQATNIHPEGFTFYSSLFKYMDSSAVTGGEILGGKTGYTGQAGLCLASLANINGRDYIFVTTGANGSHETEQFHILDAVNIYNQLGSLT